jgi:hypothetical protein
MESAQEIVFVSIFAVTLLGLAVYFVHIALVASRQLASPFFRAAVITTCTWIWCLGAVGLIACCESWARQFRHTHVALVLHDVMGVLLFFALGTFVISFAALAIGITETLLRSRQPSNQSLEPTAGRLENYKGEIRK